MLRLWFVLLMLTLGSRVAGAQPLYEHQLTASDVGVALRQALAGVQIHLHNHGPVRGDSVHAPNAASIKWPAIDGPGKRDRFTLPDASRVILGRRYGYYVDHVRADGVFIAPQPDRLTATVLLKSPGPAFVGKCVVVARPSEPCGFGGESAMPGVEWRAARIDIDLVPIAYAGSLAFDVSNVVISGEFGIASACAWPLVGTRLCATLNRSLEATKKKIAAEVKASVNDDSVKRAVSASVRTYLDQSVQIPILAVKRVSMADGFIRIGFGIRI